MTTANPLCEHKQIHVGPNDCSGEVSRHCTVCGVELSPAEVREARLFRRREDAMLLLDGLPARTIQECIANYRGDLVARLELALEVAKGIRKLQQDSCRAEATP